MRPVEIVNASAFTIGPSPTDPGETNGKWVGVLGGGVPEADNPDHAFHILFKPGSHPQPYCAGVSFSYRGRPARQDPQLFRELMDAFWQAFNERYGQAQDQRLWATAARRRGVSRLAVSPGRTPQE